jgi:hypothetical protein
VRTTQPSSQPQPTRIRTAPSPRPSVSRTVTPPVDPVKELNKLRTIGSYGKIAYADSSNSSSPQRTSSLDPLENSAVVNQPQADEQTIDDVNNADVEQSTPQRTPNTIEKIRPRWQVEAKTTKPITLASNYLPQESQILQGKQTRYLTVGTFASGVLVTPVIKQANTRETRNQVQTNDNTRSVAQLTQDLRDNYGQVAIPSGTLLAVELVSVDEGSLAIAHVRAIIKDNTEYPISTGAISINGEGGRPLIAKKLQDRGGEIARNDLFGGAVSALGKVGEIINQPDNEEEIEDEFTGRIRRRRSGNRRNVTGALLEGFFGQSKRQST